MVEHANTGAHGAESFGAERRVEPRAEMCKPAEVWMLGGSGDKQRVTDVVVHNSSFGGLAIIAKMDGAIQAGRALEIVLHPTDSSATHMAGTVTFCRSAGSHYFDIGVCVKAVGSHWIIADDVPRARARYDWFSRAMVGGGRLPRPL